AENVAAHRVVDDQDHVRIEERQRVRIEAVEQRVQRESDEQADREAQPPQGEYLTTAGGIFFVWMTITSSIVPRSTAGRTVTFLKSDGPGSERRTVPMGIPFG